MVQIAVLNFSNKQKGAHAFCYDSTCFIEGGPRANLIYGELTDFTVLSQYKVAVYFDLNHVNPVT